MAQVFSNSYDNSFGTTMDRIHIFWTNSFASFGTLIPNYTPPTILFTAFGESNKILSNILAQYLIIYDLCNDTGVARIITSTLENEPITVYGYTSNNHYVMATDVRSSTDLSKHIKISKYGNNNIYGIYDMEIPSSTNSFFVILYNDDYSKYTSHHVNVSSCDGYDISTIQNDGDNIFILPSPPYFTDMSIKSSTKFISPEIVEPEIVEPEIVEPEIVEPEIVEPEIVEPEIVEPEIVEPEIVEPEIVEPEIVEPEIVEPEIVEPEIVEPEIVEPEIVEPEIVEPEIVEPEIVEPEIVEPEIVEPEIVEPEIVEPEIVEPEIVEPEIVEPEIVEPEIVEPEIVEPEIVEPEIVEPEIVEPEIVEPEIVELETNQKQNMIIFYNEQKSLLDQYYLFSGSINEQKFDIVYLFDGNIYSVVEYENQISFYLNNVRSDSLVLHLPKPLFDENYDVILKSNTGQKSFAQYNILKSETDYSILDIKLSQDIIKVDLKLNLQNKDVDNILIRTPDNEDLDIIDSFIGVLAKVFGF